MGKIDSIALRNINQNSTSLTGKILISMPALDKTDLFKKSIIYICEHGPEGSMGIVINQIIKNIKFSDLLKSMEIKVPTSSKEPTIFFGGPVDVERGFVLHPLEDFLSKETIKINDNLGITGTIEIVKKLAVGLGPNNSIFALGYAGWGPNQLEEEIKDNFWLVTDADEEIIFKTAPNDKWEKALNKLGITPAALNLNSGNS